MEYCFFKKSKKLTKNIEIKGYEPRKSHTIVKKKKVRKIENLESFKNKIIAHRGVFDNKTVAENTIPAFKIAMQKGYWIELDVHMLQDHSIVVFHDDSLKRATGIDKKIKECTYQELEKMRLFGTKDTIPKLEEVLQEVNGKVGLIIELKYDTKIGKLEKELIKLLDNYKGEFGVESFNPFSMLWFRKNRPNYIIGQLVTNFVKEKASILEEIVIKNMLFNPILKPDFISCNITMLPNEKLEKLRKKKIIIGWTVKTKQEYEKYKKYCDSFICEKFI